MLGFGLDERELLATGQLERFRHEIEVGHARCRLELRAEIKSRSLRTRRNAGSVNALSLRARNTIGWDRQILGQPEEPDLTTAKDKLKNELLRLAQVRSQIEGQQVSPLDLLYHEANGAWPWEELAREEPAVGAP